MLNYQLTPEQHWRLIKAIEVFSVDGFETEYLYKVFCMCMNMCPVWFPNCFVVKASTFV